MKLEKIGAATPNQIGGDSGPELLGGNGSLVAESVAKSKENATTRRVLKAENGHHLDGNPRVVVEPRGGALFVGLTTIPWGWQDRARTCEFYSDRSAYLYAAKLLRMVDKAGVEAMQERERNRILRLQERRK